MPIANAKVEVWKDGVLIQTGYTDVNGKYSTTIEAGTYQIKIIKDGYLTQTKTETITRTSELMVNLASENVLGGYDYDHSVFAGKDLDKALSTYSYETEVS